MNKVKWLFVAAVVAAQLAVPAGMIRSRERVLREGALHKFPVAPVDPYDAFRGRYVAIQLDGLTMSVDDLDAWRAEKRRTAYVTIEDQPDGTARFASIGRDRPQTGSYLRVRVDPSGAAISIVPPFDRFYMDEELAPAAERVYMENALRTNRNAYAMIRVLGGRGVMEDVLIGDVPIREAALAGAATE